MSWNGETSTIKVPRASVYVVTILPTSWILNADRKKLVCVAIGGLAAAWIT